MVRRWKWNPIHSAKYHRKKVNPSHKCKQCGKSLHNSHHHFYCDDCHKYLPLDRPIGSRIKNAK